jgi:SRSO17 transposase
LDLVFTQPLVEFSVEQEAAMDRTSGVAITGRLAVYVSELTKVVGRADRAGPLRDYCSGLAATERCRSVEPMAAETAPAQVSAQRQKLPHFVAKVAWSDEQMLAKARDQVMPSMTRQGPIEG